VQTEELTEYKITVILVDLESNDYVNIHAVIFLMLANMCPLDKYILVSLIFYYWKVNDFQDFSPTLFYA
jgi:hypothetical protein